MPHSMKTEIFFQNSLLNWYQKYGRHDLPWQKQSPYHIWLSEIMLQQTQVATVIPYYLRFISKFPDIFTLAHAPLDEVLLHWAGLGYYHRAKNLHRCAQIIVKDYHGEFPSDLKALNDLPGIGPSTAAAISSQAFDLPHAILDGNVMRLLSRFFGIETSIHRHDTKKKLQELADCCMPKTQCQAYTQAIMDMGATCCKPKTPHCSDCPLQSHCYAHLQQKVSTIPLKEKILQRKTVQLNLTAYVNTQNEIWLVQREKQGIWPKLWCLPEETSQHVIAQCLHNLTHLRMDIQVSLEKKKHPIDAGIWVSEQRLAEFAIPKPIQKLLIKVFLALK